MEQYCSRTPGVARGCLGAFIALAAILLVMAYSMFSAAGPMRFAIGTLFFLAALGLVGGLLTLIWRILKGLPAFYTWVLACALAAFSMLALFVLPVLIGLLASGFGIIVVTSFLGAAIYVLARGGWTEVTRVQRIITIIGLTLGAAGIVFGTIWLLDDGSPLVLPPDSTAQVEPLAMPDPSQPGPYAVQTLFYSSGQDFHALKRQTSSRRHNRGSPCFSSSVTKYEEWTG